MSTNTDRRKFLTSLALSAAALPAAALLGSVEQASAWPASGLGTALDRAQQQTNAALQVCARVKNFALTNIGRSFGRGECTDLVDAALAASKAKPGRNYVWGYGPVALQDAVPGQVIQFWNTKFTSPDGNSWWAAEKHSAIIVGVRGPRLTLVEQNVNNVRSTVKKEYDLSWPHTGRYLIYTPMPA
jgi:hypothetical protein